MIEDRKMPFDMNALRKISIRQKRQCKKPALAIKSRSNQQSLTHAGFDLQVPRFQEIDKLLPSRRAKIKTDCAFVRNTVASVPDD